MAMPPRMVPVRAHNRIIAVPIPPRPRAAARFAGDMPMRPAVAPDMPPPTMRPMMQGAAPIRPIGAPPPDMLGPMASAGSPRRVATRTVPPPTPLEVSQGGGPRVVGAPPRSGRPAPPMGPGRMGNIADYAPKPKGSQPQARMPGRMRGR